MTIDATFWVAVSFIIFVCALIYLKVPQKVNSVLENKIEDIKNELSESEKLKEEAKNLLDKNQEKLENAKKESEQIIKNAQEESEKLIIELNDKFFHACENFRGIHIYKVVFYLFFFSNIYQNLN